MAPQVLVDLDEQMLTTVAAAVRDREQRRREQDDRWGTVEELLAQLVEGVHQMTLVMVDVNGRWKGPRPEPLHIIRPGEESKGPAVVRPSELFRHMAGG